MKTEFLFGVRSNLLADGRFGVTRPDARNGTSGDDYFGGTSGDDTYSGGAGNDTINDGGGGNDVLNGDDGNDFIRIQRFSGTRNNVTVNGGNGEDILGIDTSTNGTFTVDMGAGDDLIATFRDGTDTVLTTLGAGRDTVQHNSSHRFVFTDFETGDAGDIFEAEFLTFRAVGLEGNPFASGHLALTQDGADATLTFYRFGDDREALVVAVFQNTQIADFTAANFNGINPQAGGPGETITGTEGDDTLTGTAAGDTINGLGGNDTIDGGEGDDTIDGGTGNDTITGGLGNDTIRGGEGDDVITDAFGANIIYGDGGNDTINLTGYFGSSQTTDATQVFGGTGNDVVNVSLSATENLVADLGDGADRVNFTYPVGAVELTLGVGSDIVDINSIQSLDTTQPIIITDFQTGAGGDQLLWSDWVLNELGRSGDAGFNPFSFNEVSLTQVGNDVYMEWTTRVINNGNDLIIFRNTQVGAFTAFNLQFDPQAPTAPGDDYTGTSGDDDYVGTNLDDTARGLGGNDRLDGRGGDDDLDGGEGNDEISGGTGDDTLTGGSGDDIINGGNGADTISGGDGADTIDAGTGDGAMDTIDAGAGDDTIQFSGSNDIYIGGAGFDTLEFFAATSFGGILREALIIDFSTYLSTGIVSIGGRALTDIENVMYLNEYSNFDDTIIFGAEYTFGVGIQGGGGNDTLVGGNGDDTIEGGDGDDNLTGLGGSDQIFDTFGNNTIDAGAGDDFITTGSGNDTILGGAGNDTISPGAGADIVDAGDGDDIVTVTSFDAGDDFDGGAGNDTLQIGGNNVAINFDYAATVGSGSAPFRNFETLDFIFSSFDDRLILGSTFTSAVDFDAGSGNDVLTGGRGDDRLFGGTGSDTIRGGLGNDEIRGEGFGNGVDFDQLYGEGGNDQIYGNGRLDGGAGNDFLSGEGEFFGGAGNDSIVSFGSGDIIIGGAGTDSIATRGSSATILLEAGLNADSIDGGSGIDRIEATANGTRLQWTGPAAFDPNQGRATISGVDIVSDAGFLDFRIVGTEMDDQFQLSGFFGGGDVTIEGSAPIYGLGGNDDITGSLSDDTIYGGEGNDLLRTSAGTDTLYGGAGDDRYYIQTAGAHVLIENADEGFDIVYAQFDVTIGDHIERLELIGDARVGIGGNTANTIIGNSLDNELYGMGGNDRLEGGFGNNLLDGGDGDDVLVGGFGNSDMRGGAGRDILIGGSGDDILNGGADNDVVDYSEFGSIVVDLSITGAQQTGGAGLDTLIDIEEVIGSFGDDQITGNDGANVLTGGFGSDILSGGGNIDVAVFRGNLSEYTVVQFVDRTFGVLGPDGEDLLIDIEFAQFDDQTLRLLRGTGVSVTFETADPLVYQDAMNAIRDFDGNALGGNGSWLRIGSADVNGDGDIDQILVNDAIGRFATVGTAPDGLVYFEDHGWAGETRVAGIYIDPLVEAGIVEQFSANDSQRRFQNDLQIENINRVLGADDYDGDGLQEVYFALTDGTAYLRAIMEFDGNIRYANYQSEQEVIDYLTANGFGPETYGDWFNPPTSSGPSGGPKPEAALDPELDPATPVGALSEPAPIFAIDPLQAEFVG